jgi:hypothetical protein
LYVIPHVPLTCCTLQIPYRNVWGRLPQTGYYTFFALCNCFFDILRMWGVACVLLVI